MGRLVDPPKFARSLPVHGTNPHRRRCSTASKNQSMSDGNAQIAKADDAAPGSVCIAAMPCWKHDMGRRIDRLIRKITPGVCKAMKWNSPP